MRGPCRGPEIEELDNQLRVVLAPEKSPKRRKQPSKNVSKERIGAWHQFASQAPICFSEPHTLHIHPFHPKPTSNTKGGWHQSQKVGGTN